MHPIFLIFLLVTGSILIIFLISYYQYQKSKKVITALKVKHKANHLKSIHRKEENEILEEELRVIKTIYRNKLIRATSLEKEIV